MFKKGNKLAGSRLGSPNKKTEQWEQFSQYCLEGGLAKFEKELNTLKGKQFVDCFISILEFHKPKLARSVDKEGEDIQPEKLTIEIIHSGPKLATSEKEADV
jgi:hypothetical protein